jgi:subtilisin family serine protease
MARPGGQRKEDAVKRPKHKGLLVLDRHLPGVRAAVPGLPEGSRRADGLVWVDAPIEEVEKSLAAGVGAAGEPPVVAPNLLMSVPVEGQPRLWHGFGGAEPAPRRLPDRTDSKSGGGVLVGVIDTGIRHHPWLSGGYLAAPDDIEPVDVDDDGRLEQQAGHGTFIAGLVLQQAPAAGVWVEKALDTAGDGFTAEVAEAAVRLAERGVHILNLSLGCYADHPAFREVLAHVVTTVHRIDPDLVVVAAAGNLGEGQEPEEFWPAALPDVVGVGAVRDGERHEWASFSNRGTWVDFAAPGEDLVSTYFKYRPGKRHGPEFNGWAVWDGTSFATAVVSGAIARTMTEHDESAKDAVERLRNEAKAHTDDDLRVPVIDRVRWESSR